MGQKINPLGFRLGTNQAHYSLWFSKPKTYAENLQEDQKIRAFIKNYVQKNRIKPSATEGIASIYIKKRLDLIQVIIYMGFPKIFMENSPQGVEELQKALQKKIKFCKPKTEYCYHKN
ncbi:unnamed protein product [Cuscuta epithymum]|uniref:Ribosomal protein S3 n=1 Tax=Cuscuta epithymum TaxID=186058 RepID=A0AAV0EBU1_9ASTE|nr:unnamed protein product [Cuscuta epithymum]